jgi:aminoglycoside phosphotransferase (APT) family kinase protein
MTAPSFAGTGAVRAAHRFDEDRLVSWMAANVPGFEGPLRVEQFNGGQSNPTYKLVTPGHRYVLRRKPPGRLLPGAHAVDREAQVIRAVEGADFPVPHVHALCTDEDVIGTWFYVMDMVDGRIFWNAALPGETPAGRAAIYDAMNAAIAHLHSIDPDVIGLGEYGRRGKYIERQVARWSRQYLADDIAGRDPNLDRLIAWLPDHIPADGETTLVHGDFRIDNLIFATDDFEVRAVLDWELSTLGHPLADFAYHLMMYRMPALTIPGLVGSDLATLGIPSEREYVAAYCRRTGRAGIPDLDFYVAFNLFRFATICHGIKARLLRGTAASAEAGRLAADMPALAALAWEQAERAT